WNVLGEIGGRERLKQPSSKRPIVDPVLVVLDDLPELSLVIRLISAGTGMQARPTQQASHAPPAVRERRSPPIHRRLAAADRALVEGFSRQASRQSRAADVTLGEIEQRI